MTKLILDPLSLSLEFPKASESRIHRVRILCQVVEYDDLTATLKVCRVPTIHKLHTEINLIDEPTVEECTLNVNLIGVLDKVNVETISVGSIVNMVGYFNGADVNVIECYSVNGSSIIPENNVKVLEEISKLRDFE
ncbi:uncharacterized protein AC631_04080 [Debaryomyces fabryi]|uniref:Uncharacterized protein n=1 Tax=Debaryomyces fabryi TaxID=58627 RepID=A0A0V1PVE1_9ASCO|nr:uncharacterized protein AC631_04080 [Debaryomyces fabryi]KSA00163.1 hypothetical protein AC631_04080 [Debaryomyces fabryi]CUM54485.1 unnamed protein product [Debaryomyces fabryi]